MSPGIPSTSIRISIVVPVALSAESLIPENVSSIFFSRACTGKEQDRPQSFISTDATRKGLLFLESTDTVCSTSWVRDNSPKERIPGTVLLQSELEKPAV
jgi:hypothetical protein